jgi:hypothetical protein
MTPSGEGNLLRRLEELERENRLLRQQLQRALEEKERLKQEHARLRREIERLRRQLEEALRAAKRQAAPFSRRQPKPNPKPPGRKAGEEYGRRPCRPFPARVDERIAVPLPARCPGLEATNNAAERALRGVVIARKVWGGNRTWNGVRTQGILASLLRTCRPQGQDVFALLVGLLRSPAAHVLEMVPNGRSP